MHDSQGNYFNLEAAEKNYAYNPDGSVATITAEIAGVTRVRTYTYDNGVLATVSKWEPQ